VSNDVIQYAYVAGEISPSYLGRTDYENYDLAVERAQNFFINYRGGATSRAGSEFGDYILHDDKPVRQFEFSFSTTGANVYNLLFGDFYVRFIQENAYILEDPKSLTAITNASPGVFTSTGHLFVNGDWVKLTNLSVMTDLQTRTLVVKNVTTNTFTLEDVFGTDINTSTFGTYVSGASVSRVYTLTTPYAAADLEALKKDQLRDTIRLTHSDYTTRNLNRLTANSWTITEEIFENTVTKPAISTATASATGTAGVVYAITAVDFSGVESLVGGKFFVKNIVNFPATVGSVELTWPAISTANFYKVYRSIVLPDLTKATLNAGMQLGYVGSIFGNEFTDNNIIPDFGLTPPTGNNPFANGKIVNIQVTSIGTGYTDASTVSVSGGTGFVGYPIVNSAGQITAVVVENGGKDYTTSSVVTFSIGSGAVGAVTVSLASGNNPSVSVIYQQRQVYAATLNQYLTLFGSKTNQFSNFDHADVVLDSDSYEHTIDSDTVMPIRHLVPTRGGLIVMAEKAIWKFTSSEGAVITPSNAFADPQSFVGAANLTPLQIDTDILYLENKNLVVRLLAYNDFSKLFKGEDRSLLANHLFPEDERITSWTYADTPNKLVYAVRSDGVLLCFTVVKEQNVYAWTPSTTQGKYTDVISIEENSRDVVYQIVEREIRGQTKKYFERIPSRLFLTVDDIWCLDAALDLGHTYGVSDLSVEAITGDSIKFTTTTPAFTSSDIGSIIRSGGGKAVVISYTSTTEVICRILRPITKLKPEVPTIPAVIPSGQWTIDVPISSVSGLHHLEGKTVGVLVDGNVIPDQVVIDGVVTFPSGVTGTNVVVGLRFTCILRTLPPTSPNSVIEGRRISAKGVSVRYDQSRGIKVGADLNTLFPIKDRTDEFLGEPTLLKDKVEYMIVPTGFEDNGQVYFVQDDPLPATILGHVMRLDVGDDPGN